MVWIYVISSLHRRLFQDGFHAYCWQSHPHAQAHGHPHTHEHTHTHIHTHRRKLPNIKISNIRLPKLLPYRQVTIGYDLQINNVQLPWPSLNNWSSRRLGLRQLLYSRKARFHLLFKQPSYSFKCTQARMPWNWSSLSLHFRPGVSL